MSARWSSTRSTASSCGLRYGRADQRRSRGRLVAMTQRIRLDAYLAEQAAAAGADLRDGTKVTAVRDDGAVETADGTLRADAVIGADGVNGVTARSVGLGGAIVYGVALEGNVPNAAARAERYAGTRSCRTGHDRRRLRLGLPEGRPRQRGRRRLGAARGRALRAPVAPVRRARNRPATTSASLRGYRLPLRRPASSPARGRRARVGDAAGLVDPLSGDGMYEAFVSGRLAADAALDVLAGRSRTLEPYAAALDRAIGAPRRRLLESEARARSLPARHLRAARAAARLAGSRRAGARRPRASRRGPRPRPRAAPCGGRARPERPLNLPKSHARGRSQPAFPAYSFLPPGAPVEKPVLTVSSWR